MAVEQLRIETGSAEVSGEWTPAADAWAALALAPGAGGGLDMPFLVGFAEAMAEGGVATLRFNFPYRERGRQRPDPPAVAIATWREAFAETERRGGGIPVAVGGKSYGGRMASMAVAEWMPARALVFLGYPFHPPGAPEKVRDEHLYRIEVPMLFLQGTRDPFSQLDLFERVTRKLGDRAVVHVVEGGDHSFRLPGRKVADREIGRGLGEQALAFLRKAVH